MPDTVDPAAPPPLLLFDAACPLCRTLAEMALRRMGGALRAQAWQEFQSSPEAAALAPSAHKTLAAPADRLRLLAGNELLEGEAAWAFLLANYRDLAALNWLAARTGLTQPLARSAASAGHLLRRVCRRCPRPEPKR